MVTLISDVRDDVVLIYTAIAESPFIFSLRSLNPGPIPPVRQPTTLPCLQTGGHCPGLDPFPGASQTGGVWQRTALGQRCGCFPGGHSGIPPSTSPQGWRPPNPLSNNSCHFRKQPVREAPIWRRIRGARNLSQPGIRQNRCATDARRKPRSMSAITLALLNRSWRSHGSCAV